MKETEYQKFMRMSDKCIEKALYYYKINENYLSTFFKNASEGLKAKALSLMVGE